VAARSILITGCSSGIGYDAARTLHARGWQVFAACRRGEDVARLAAEGLAGVRLDYADAASIAAAVETVLAATGGRLDALFNNGAYSHPGAIEDLATADLRTLFEVNFIGWHDLTRRVIPVMRAQRSGRIVNCSSVVGFLAQRFAGAYVASKFAVEGWSDTLRLELAGTGIRVSLIEPGPIRTRFQATARARFLTTVAGANSAFAEDYRRELVKLDDTVTHAPFELGPQAVTRRLVHALESRRPRVRYRVTVLAHLAALARRLVPTPILDWFLVRLQR
jgi:NAD(P)-dependent dehydrogenase (short-subunit alcohol dehydrogenase family)